ncbi:MAG: hypothetical protein FWE60_03680 [Oscillospiraceae bacterium]|nr:hypothetical protein [Oscillospiraceae bacterium]
MTKRKKIVIIISTLIFVILISVFAYFLFQPQLVTGNKKDLTQIVIIEFPHCAERAKTYTITEQTEMYTIYSVFRYARPIARRAYPAAITSQDARYQFTFHYSDRVDEVFVFRSVTARHLGRPDTFTESRRLNSEQVTELLDSLLIGA